MITTEKGLQIPEDDDFYSIEYVKNNIPIIERLIDKIIEDKLNKIDIANNLTTATAGKVLDALQGYELKKLVDEKAPKSHVNDIGNGSDFGHVKVSDTYASKLENGGAENGLAASQNALYSAYSKLDTNLSDDVIHFPNMNSVIASMAITNTSSECRYTATQNCWAFYSAYKTSDNTASDCVIYINDKIIAQDYLSDTYARIYAFVPLKSGDSIRFNNANFHKNYVIYGIR